MTLGAVAAAQAALLTTVPLLMEALSLGADELGVAVAAGLLATLAFAPVAGAFADRLGPASTARGGLAVVCAASAALCGYTALVLDGAIASAAAFALVAATRVANGVGVATLHPSAQAWLWDKAGDTEGMLLQGRASAVQNIGRVIGPAGAALVGGLGAAWTLAALAAVCMAALLVLVLTPAPATRVARMTPQAGEPPHDLRPRGTWPLLAALLSLHMLGGGAQFLLGPLLVARLGLGAAEAARWAGWLMTLAAAASVAGSLLAHHIQDRRRVLVGVGLATAGAAVLAPFAGVASVAAGVAAVGAGIGAAVPSVMAELMRRSPPHARGRAAGQTTATQAAAYAVATPACGFLFAANPVLAAALLPVPAVAAWLAFAMAGRGRLGIGAENGAGQQG